jgi:hypothetical protein
VATAVFTGESISGWQQVNFTTPVAVSSGTTYVASYYTPTGHYSADDGYFTAGIDAPPLHALANGIDGPNGVYTYGNSAFPSSTFNAANYWVDVVLSSATATSGPSVLSVSPAQGATGIFTGTSVTAMFNEAIDTTTLTGSTFRVQDSSGNAVSATIAYSPSTNTATLSTSAPLVPLTTYTVTLVGGSTDPRVKDLLGNALATSFSWSFTTGIAGCPCSIFGLSSAPRGVDSDDGTPVEVGVKFRSDISGFVTGIRFYKSLGNTGTHIGNLWTSAGSQLATGTFVGESSSGWQQVRFATPVAINANTT